MDFQDVEDASFLYLFYYRQIELLIEYLKNSVMWIIRFLILL